MSQVLTGVLQKVQDLLPNQIGANRKWSQTSVERHIMFADRLVRERTENLYHQQEITLVADTPTYTLDSEFIDITGVEFAYDGSLYDWYLKPATLDDLDKISIKWRNDSGSRPDYYTVLGALGTPSSEIQIYRPMDAASVQTLRVTGIGMGAGTLTCPDDIQNKCHVPHVMSVLLAKQDPKQAAGWFGQYLAGTEELRRRTISKNDRGTMRVGVGW